MNEAIVVRGVTKTFGRKVAVRDLNLVVPTGGTYGFIGPNGAGKTTTIRMIMAILFPDSGELSVLGHGSALDAKDRIGYLPEERGVYKKMKVGRFLSYIGRLKGLSASDARERGERWLERVGLADVAGKRCEELSKGMQQKVQFVSTVIHEPDLLILDEPFSGLDPVIMRLLRQLIREQHERGATIIFSTHVMLQAEELCDHVVMIHDGEKVLDDAIADIRARHDPRTIRFEAMSPDADLSALRDVPGVLRVEPADRGCLVTLEEGRDPAQAMQALAAALPPALIELHRPTLEDVFVELVTGPSAGAEREEDELRAALRSESAAGGSGAAAGGAP